jgi:hypothetical protein
MTSWAMGELRLCKPPSAITSSARPSILNLPSSHIFSLFLLTLPFFGFSSRFSYSHDVLRPHAPASSRVLSAPLLPTWALKLPTALAAIFRTLVCYSSSP